MPIPVAVSVEIVKSPASVPLSDQVMPVVPSSSSCAAYTTTLRSAVAASYSISMNEGAVWLVPVVVIAGVSSTLVTVTVTGKVPVLTPVLPPCALSSSASRTISYMLLEPPIMLESSRSAGFSKSGLMLNDSTPVVELIEKCPASVPVTAHVTESPSSSGAL